jgi:hypothetical protein
MFQLRRIYTAEIGYMIEQMSMERRGLKEAILPYAMEFS